MLASVEQAIEDIRQGKFVIVVDDEDAFVFEPFISHQEYPGPVTGIDGGRKREEGLRRKLHVLRGAA